MPIRLARCVKVILVLNLIAFLLQQTADQFMGLHLMAGLALVPAAFFHEYRVWQILTYAFMHSSVLHLFFDMMVIAFIGSELEFAWGTKRFLRYFLFCSVVSGFVYLLARSGSYEPMLGSSGAIYGLLVAYGLIFGERILLFMMLFPMKAKHFIWVLALVELLTTFYSAGGAVASLSHLSAIVFGFFYLWGEVRMRMRAKNRLGIPKGSSNGLKFLQRWAKKKSKHLRLVVDNDKDLEKDEEPRDKPRTWH